MRYATAVTAGLILALGCADAGTAPDLTSVVIEPRNAVLAAIDDRVQLSAQVTGSSARNRRIAWSSSNPAVASVDTTGLVRALAAGEVTVTATIAGAASADTAVIMVAPRVASLVVTPERDTLDAGATRHLVAEARDANGHAIPNPLVTWMSSDTTVAAVDASGTVTARREGSTQVRGRAGDVEGGAQIVVRGRVLRLTRDTALSGNIGMARLEIPAGVRLTVAGDLVLRASESVLIEGDVAGNCTRLDVRAGGPVRISGAVRMRCTDPAVGKALALTVFANGDLDLRGAVIEAAGPIELSNDSTIPRPRMSAAGRSGAAFAYATAAASSGVLPKCTAPDTITVVRGTGAKGKDRSPHGTDGDDGAPIGIICDGDLELRHSTLLAGDGGAGGRGTATTAEAGRGGRGGNGGHIMLVATGSILLHDVFLAAGHAGAGGWAEGGPLTKPEAIGGDGGTHGWFVVAAPRVTLTDGLRILLGSLYSGTGGDASAEGPAGVPAGAQPAGRGGAASATGGNGATIGVAPGLKILGDLIRGSVTGAQFISVTAHGSRGGTAWAVGGRGGSGNRQHKPGAPGGDMTAIGGNAGDILVLADDVHHQLLPTTGSTVFYQEGRGGAGYVDCIVGQIEAGGPGGKGGDVFGRPGRAGLVSGQSSTGEPGNIVLYNAANGGNGGHGVPVGTGGPAGAQKWSSIGTGVNFSIGPSFQPGADGSGCEYASATTFTPVPGNPHEGVLRWGDVKTGRILLLAGSAVRIDLAGVILNGTIEGATIVASGTGTRNNRTASATLSGIVELDSLGRLVAVTGFFTFGAGGELPGGVAGQYSFGAIRIP